MPVYEYQCTTCGQVEEAFQKIFDPPFESCNHCDGAMKKLISQSSFHLKGSGWYVTDYGGHETGSDTKSAEKIDKKSKEIKTTSKTAETE